MNGIFLTHKRTATILPWSGGYSAQLRYNSGALSIHEIKRRVRQRIKVLHRPPSPFERRFRRSPWPSSRVGHHKCERCCKNNAYTPISPVIEFSRNWKGFDCNVADPSRQFPWVWSFAPFRNCTGGRGLYWPSRMSIAGCEKIGLKEQSFGRGKFSRASWR